MAKEKKQKIRRPRAETPKGFRDYFGADVAERNAMLAKITDVYHRYGFDPLETPAVETVEALGKFLPDVDRPNAGVFAWRDEDEAWMALRYDLTAPLARVFAQFRNNLPTPYRRYAVGPVWRNEKPGPGRYRQFYQCDADTVGTPTVAADAEICAMLCDTLEAVGIERGDYIVRLNNRKVLDGALEAAGVFDPSNPSELARQRGIVMRAMDKFDRLGPDGVRALLGKERVDESGDVTEGAGLSPDQAEVLMGVIQVQTANLKLKTHRAVVTLTPSGRSIPNHVAIEQLRQLIGTSPIGNSGLDELEQISELTEAQGYGADRIMIDPSVVRGLAYYTGPVYEAELTFEILDEEGRKRQFGSVAGGGRYDDLVKRFTGQEVPATGISIGVDRLLAALREKGRVGSDTAGPVVVTVMDRARMADYQAMVAELRDAGLRAEVYLGNPKDMGRQLKYADKRRSPVAVIEGADEYARGKVQLKDLALGARLAADIGTRDEWRAQPAQIEVARGDLVAEVRNMIARAEG